MLTIDIRKLNAQRKYSGELDFEFTADESLIGIPYVGFAGPVKAHLAYDILEDDSVEVTGTVSFRLKGACSRCLKPAERSFGGEVDAYFVQSQAEEDEYLYQNGTVDLTDCLSDAVALAMPGRLECEEPCAALEWREEI